MQTSVSNGLSMAAVKVFAALSMLLLAAVSAHGQTGSSAARTAVEAQKLVPEQWVSKLHGDNPLVGRMFNAKGVEVPPLALLRRAAVTKFLLLGEQHDNPDHHVIQGNFLTALAPARTFLPVLLEMVPERLNPQLQVFDLNTDPDLKDFAGRLEWEKRGWYSFDIYRPMVEAALRNSLPLFAGNLDRSMTRAISKGGLSALDKTERAAMAVDAPMSDALRNDLLDELKTSHCGLMGGQALPAMANVQRARDGFMASRMAAVGQRAGAMLIAGNGHVRRDRGVPLILRTLLPGIEERKVATNAQGRDIVVRVPRAHTMSVGMLEVRDGLTTLSDYDLTGADGSPLYDYVIFTPRFDDTDHCAELHKRMKAPKQ